MCGDVLTSTDVLIIGGGAAGLRAAIAAREAGVDVILASKAPIGYASSTLYAGGGFRAAFGDYTFERHFEETIIGGKFLNDQELVRTLVLEGPDRLLELEKFGVKVHVRSGGVSVSATPPINGYGLTRPLRDYAKGIGVRFLEGVMALDLVKDEVVGGAVFYNISSGSIFAVEAKAVILATGGYSRVYLRTDNPVRVSGDGCVMALKAGATLIDMEFAQFFPLGLAEKGLPAWLFPTSSGRLLNSFGEDILKKYGLDVNLYTAIIQFRDLTSRIIWREISEGRGVDEAVILELPVSPSDQIPVGFTGISKVLAEAFNLRSNRVRVSPTAHFTMGGVRINLKGETGVPGLYACGEITGGVHGANRLGGNALTEAIVFGARAGVAAAEWVKEIDRSSSVSDDLIRYYENLINSFRNGRFNVRELCFRVKRAMWINCGIIRDENKLKLLLSDLKEIKEDLAEVYASSRSEVLEAFELRNLVQVSELVAMSSLLRRESRGAHYRSDFPEQNDSEWLRHICLSLRNERLVIDYEPVNLKYLGLKR